MRLRQVSERERIRTGKKRGNHFWKATILAQMATNYPLIRRTNASAGHVQYLRTHGFIAMAVATGSTPVSALFDVPPGTEAGSSMLAVVVNGIPSASVNVTVVSLVRICAPDRIFCNGFDP